MAKLNDIALVSEQLQMRIAPGGVKSLIEHLIAKGYLADATVNEGEGYCEIQATAGDFGHAVFYEGPKKEAGVPFTRFTLKHGSAPFNLGYGPKGKCHFFLEFAGTSERDLTDEFLDRVHTITYLYPILVVTKHDAKRKR
jgi:hypothetical protein